MSGAENDMVITERVEVVDGEGNLHATLTREGLTLYDGDGRGRVVLALEPLGPVLAMWQDGKPLIEFRVREDREGVDDPGVLLTLNDGEGRPAAGFFVRPDGRVEQFHNPRIGDRYAGR
jgi:hypothetical protein